MIKLMLPMNILKKIYYFIKKKRSIPASLLHQAFKLIFVLKMY